MKSKNKKNIYILLSKTNTKMGKFIRYMTKYNYNHVSVSLDENFKEIYSFSRYYENTPFVGGFVVESILRYKRSNAQIKIFKIPVDKKTYNELKTYIEFLKIYQKKYIYNTFSAIFSIFKININIKDSYTCIEFTKHLFDNFNIVAHTKKDFNSIKNVDNLLYKYKYFEGSCNELNINNDWGIDLYLIKKNIFLVYSFTFIHISKLLLRKMIWF